MPFRAEAGQPAEASPATRRESLHRARFYPKRSRGAVVPHAAEAECHPKSIGVSFSLVQAAPDLFGRPTSLRAKHRKVEERKTPCKNCAPVSHRPVLLGSGHRHVHGTLAKHRTLLAGWGPTVGLLRPRKIDERTILNVCCWSEG